MATYITTTSELTAVADAIRAKANTQSALVFPSGFVSTISAIQTGSAAPAATASEVYAANQGNKIAVTLNAYGNHDEMWNDMDSSGQGALGLYLDTYAPNYLMVADSNGDVLWKGPSMYNSYSDMMSNMNTSVMTGGQIVVSKTSVQTSSWDEETQMDSPITQYEATIATIPTTNTVAYLSTTSF